jgi:hypothetical protein
MARYLHHYESEEDFLLDYNDTEVGPVSITCNGKVYKYYKQGMYAMASVWKGEGREVVTMTRDVAPLPENVDELDDDARREAYDKARFFHLETFDEYRLTGVLKSGDIVTAFTCTYEHETSGQVTETYVYDREDIIIEPRYNDYYSWQNGNEFVATGTRDGKTKWPPFSNGKYSPVALDTKTGEEYDVTAVGENMEATYHEPWVSLTEGKRKVITGVSASSFGKYRNATITIKEAGIKGIGVSATGCV